MRNSIYEKGPRPIDKSAAVVVSRGTHFVPKLKDEPTTVEQRHPLPIRPIVEVPVNLRHLVGYKFGRLTVIGFSTQPKRWVVRCACGIYLIRTSAAIKNPENGSDACRTCWMALYQQKREMMRRLGREVTIKEVPGAFFRPPMPAKVTTGNYEPRQFKAIEPPPPPPAPDIPLHHTELRRSELERERQLPNTMQLALQAALVKR